MAVISIWRASFWIFGLKARTCECAYAAPSFGGYKGGLHPPGVGGHSSPCLYRDLTLCLMQATPCCPLLRTVERQGSSSIPHRPISIRRIAVIRAFNSCPSVRPGCCFCSVAPQPIAASSEHRNYLTRGQIHGRNTGFCRRAEYSTFVPIPPRKHVPTLGLHPTAQTQTCAVKSPHGQLCGLARFLSTSLDRARSRTPRKQIRSRTHDSWTRMPWS